MHENKNSWPEVLLTSADENAKRIYEKDWSLHSMGPIENWSPSFITTLTTAIGSRFPALMLWGSQFITFYNAGYGAVLGDKQLWALGKPLQEVWPEAWDSLYGMLKGVIATGNGSWAEDQIYYLHRNGYPEESYFTFSFARILDERGGFGGILCTAIETTQKVIGERRLKTLREIGNLAGVKSTVEEVYTESLEILKQQTLDIPSGVLRVVSADKSTADVFGHFGMEAPPQSVNLFGNDIHPVLKQVFESGVSEFIDKLPANVTQSHDKVVGRGEIRSAFLLPIKISSNSTVLGFLAVGLSPHLPFDESYRSFLDLLAGQISAAVGSAKVQEEVRDRAKALAELHLLKNTFFSNVSHEFRTPLTLLIGPLEDAMQRSKGKEISLGREAFESVYRNALRLLKLVNSLLDFSRMEAGRIDASFEPVELAKYTEGLASQFRSVMEKGGLILEIKVDALTEPIFVDREMWEMIVLNLLSNAFKFTLHGTVRILLRELPDEVELTVEDSGIGISKDELPKIFHRFHRVEGAKSRTFEGSGIGLALVQDMVKLHSGKITVESAEGKGTLFRVTIPKGNAHLPFNHIKAEGTSTFTQVKTHAFIEEASRWVPEIVNDNIHTETKRTILVVDDNADMRDYLTRILDQDYRVVAAADGREALRVIQMNGPDLIISDIMMPEMNGFELLKELRRHEKTSRLPVIFLSARAGNEATVEGFEAGADDYLIKPFSSKELLARVKTQLSMAALVSDLESERRARVVKDESLSIAAHELQRSNTELAQFAYLASHDLQEPIRKIVNFSQMLEQSLGHLDIKSKNYFDKIQESASRMLALIRDLLSYSQLSKEQIIFERVDLNKVIENIKNDFDLMIEQKEAVIECSILPEIEAIPLQMEQLFSNLLSNALKYTRKDVPPVIVITASLLSKGEKEKNVLLGSKTTYYKIEIKDNGIGIDQKHVNQIFEIFQRLHRQSEFAGTGIGLAMCKKIVQNHHGDIYITTTKTEEGTTFNIILPKKISALVIKNSEKIKSAQYVYGNKLKA